MSRKAGVPRVPRALGLALAACIFLQTKVLTFLPGQGRRMLLSAAVAGVGSLPSRTSAQEGVPAKTGGRASKWFGTYEDPKHPSCDRSVVVSFDGTKGKIDGYDKSGSGDEGSFNCRKRRDVQYYDWTLKIRLASKDADELVVEEAGRDVVDRKRIPAPQETVGKWDKDGILWPDGTKWVQKKWER
mmetsp:Transcript_143190/g.202490  ORF Transcript_143190/g.202490 Transcript_143190/m.202490 type:complete len:186 (+) Transcript_143190:55-612(+)